MENNLNIDLVTRDGGGNVVSSFDTDIEQARGRDGTVAVQREKYEQATGERSICHEVVCLA